MLRALGVLRVFRVLRVLGVLRAKKMNMKIKIIRILAIIIASLSLSSASAQTADSVMKKTAEKINVSSGLSASFSLVSGNNKVSGTLKSSGRKFAIRTSSASTWYDGKSMWTYNANSGETILTTPTAQEVAEANPLSLVNSYAASFTAAFSKTAKKGSKTIVLTPKSKKLGYKSVHVTISDATSLPVSIVVVPSSGQRMTLSISNVKLNAAIPASTFVYPKKDYPKAEIVDLR